jgi:hypothetical protein
MPRANEMLLDMLIRRPCLYITSAPFSFSTILDFNPLFAAGLLLFYSALLNSSYKYAAKTITPDKDNYIPILVLAGKLWSFGQAVSDLGHCVLSEDVFACSPSTHSTVA